MFKAQLAKKLLGRKKTLRLNPLIKKKYGAVKAVPNPPEPKNFGVKLLDRDNHDPSKQVNTKELIARVVSLAQILAEKKFYPYQIEPATRIVESLLDHDGQVITALMSRQAGKTQALGSIVAAIGIVFPSLAQKYPGDWRLNITDSNGVYRGYAYGIQIGIYAPILEQSDIMFQRVKQCLNSTTGTRILRELGLKILADNGGKVRFSNSSLIVCSSASEQSKIEGATYHLLILEECQDISDLKIRKSLHPMTAATLGTIVKIGTASTKVCDFYTSICNNKRIELVTEKKSHFCYPYTVAIKYNSFYARHVDNEKARLGEDSDEFRTSYSCEFIFERGMFVTQDQLFSREVVQRDGPFSQIYLYDFPASLNKYALVAALDWGASYDSTVLTVVAVNWSHPFESGFRFQNGEHGYYEYYRKHVVYWQEYIGDNYEHQFGEIVGILSNMRGLKRIVTDSNACGKPIFDRLASVFNGSGVEVVPFNFSPKVKSDGYKDFYADLCGKRFTFPAGESVRKTKEYKKFTQQMLDLRKDYRNGMMQVAHPDEKGAHDDYSDSAMMANFGANMPSLGNIQVMNNNPFISQTPL